ncbi:MAG: tetratricopeptide repeat protein, partial [Candidatus Heimdallarchaeota archaeon]|nr:tetratricopeptide repeat protein [Candidatus Heimdallarchaeota archaeon]
DAGKYDLAKTFYMEVLKRKIDHAEAINNRGDLSIRAGNKKVAKELFRKAITIKPNYVSALKNLAIICIGRGENLEAHQYIERALKVDPKDSQALILKSNALLSEGKTSEALNYLKQLTKDNPKKLSFHLEMGVAQLNALLYAECAKSMKRCLEIDPKNIDALYTLASAQHGMDGSQNTEILNESEKNAKLALELIPDHLPSLVLLYMICMQGNRLEEAAQHYDTAMNAKDVDKKFYGRTSGTNIVTGLQFRNKLRIPVVMDSVAEIREMREQLSHNIDELTGKKLLHPDQTVAQTNFYLAYHGIDNCDLMKRVANLYINSSPELLYTAPHCEKLLIEKPTTKPQRLKIAFISDYLRGHTIGKLTLKIIELLPRDRFEIIVIRPMGYRDQFTKSFDVSVDRSFEIPLNLEKMHEIISSLELDIIFYPDIGMLPATYYLAFSRLAPVQLVTWGHPDTTGIPNIDYFISSRFIEPDGAQKHYSEQLIMLNNMLTCFQIPEVPEQLIDRGRFGFSDDDHIYVCPQTLFKFHPDFDYILGQILSKDPKGKLVMVTNDMPMYEKLRNRMARSFPEHMDRVVNTGKISKDDFLRLVACADANLDPINFSGGNSSYEAFSVNSPIVTLPGDFMRARVTYGIYQQMGMYDLVAKDPDDYIRLALKLAN